MKQLRLSELYVSIQGEGPRAGQPTTFVRFAGCNLKCPLWPCDTQHAIDPKIFEKEQRLLLPEDLVTETPNYPKNVCLTGGEPFIQNQEALERYVGYLSDLDHTVETFTNGTIRYPEWAFDQLGFVMDWKLPGSGEDPYNRVRLENLVQLKKTDRVKFVISDGNDFGVAMELWHKYHDWTEATFTAGVAWGKLETEELVSWMLRMELPWELNVQVHNYIWNREKRGI